MQDLYIFVQTSIIPLALSVRATVCTMMSHDLFYDVIATAKNTGSICAKSQPLSGMLVCIRIALCNNQVLSNQITVNYCSHTIKIGPILLGVLNIYNR